MIAEGIAFFKCIGPVAAAAFAQLSGFNRERAEVAQRLCLRAALLEKAAFELTPVSAGPLWAHLQLDSERLLADLSLFDMSYGAASTSLTDLNIFPRKIMDKLQFVAEYAEVKEATVDGEYQAIAVGTASRAASAATNDQLVLLRHDARYVHDGARELANLATSLGLLLLAKRIWRAKVDGLI